MKKSLSCPCLHTLPTSPHMSRRTSMSIPHALVPDVSPWVQMVREELQMEAVAHAAASHAGSCILTAPHVFLDPDHASEEDKKGMAACLATPGEGPSQRRTHASSSSRHVGRSPRRVKEDTT